MRSLRKVRYVFKKQRRHLHRVIDDSVQFIADVLYDKKRTLSAKVVGTCLVPFSFLFFFIVKLRVWLYQKRIFRSQSLGCHVIVVGNITVGGTGKTPIAEYLAKLLLSLGRRPAIISRGYKSKSEPRYKRFFRWLTHSPSTPPKVVSDGCNVLMDSEYAGDEPYMLAKNLNGVPVVVDKDRVKAGRYAIKRFKSDVLILDDGYQYLRLKSTLRIVLVDRSNPFGNYYLLPRGILREPLSHLNRASCIVLTKSNGIPSPVLSQNIHHVNRGAQFAECCHQPCFLVSRDGSEVLPLEVLQGKNVALFCAIASPEGFEKFITKLGANIIYRKRYIDHHRFTDTELLSIDELSRNADFLLTTEKDSVRIAEDFKFSAPFYYLKVNVKFLANEDRIKSLIEETLKIGQVAQNRKKIS